MSTRTLFLLATALLLLSGSEALAQRQKKKVIILSPGQTRVFKQKKQVYSGLSRSPKVGDKKRELRVTGATVKPKAVSKTTSKGAKPASAGGAPVSVKTSSDAIKVSVAEEAAGKEYTVTIKSQARVWVYQVSRGRSLRGRTRYAWVRRPNESHTETVDLLVDMAKPPTVIVPVGGRLKLELPPKIEITRVDRKTRKTAAVEGRDNTLIVNGFAEARERFDFTYRLDGQKRPRVSLYVEVGAQKDIPVVFADRTKTEMVSFERLGLELALKELEVRAIEIDDRSIVRVEQKSEGLEFVALDAGVTTVFVEVAGMETKLSKPRRMVVQLRVPVNVSS